MSSKERQEQIIEILEKEGYVTVKYLTDALHYSSATINRDLNALQSKQLITRSYGGVELMTTTYVPVFWRTHKTHTAKKYIGKEAASFVHDGDTIFIDGSTTAQYMTQYLIHIKNLTVITNNIVLAADLSTHGINVICLGGTVVEAPSMLYGDETVENASKYMVDKMFFSTTAVSSDGIISSGVYDLLFKTLFKHAKEVFYLVDHKKVDKPFQRIFCDLQSVDHVISDHTFADEVQAKYSRTNFVTVEVAKERM